MQLAVFMENQLRGPLYCRCRTSAERLHQGMGAADALREEGGDHEMPGQEEFAHSHDNAHEKGFGPPSPFGAWSGYSRAWPLPLMTHNGRRGTTWTCLSKKSSSMTIDGAHQKVMVITQMLFLDALCKAFLTLDMVSLMIFHEFHRIMKVL